VPSSGGTVVEGGGLRTWSMASGLLELGHEVVVAVPKAFSQTNDSKIPVLT
jgi:hypothetical protein